MFISNDTYTYFSKLTFQKIKNLIGLYVTYYLSKFFRKPLSSFYPTSVAIEPTTSCNLRCPECPSGLRSFTRTTGMLQTDFFRLLIDQLYKKITYLTFYFQGEPYLNPSFLEMVTYASQRKIYTATSTNAHYLDEKTAKATVNSGLDRLIISIDGITQETYQSYRVGGKLHKVIEGTKNVLKHRAALKSKTPYVIFQFLVVKPNEHEIEMAKRLAKEIGVDDIHFKTAQIYDYQEGSPLIPTIGKYSRYKKTKQGTYQLKNKLTNSCWKMWHSCVITWDGKIVPCCFDKDAKHSLGTLQKDSFRKIWFGQGYKQFRSAVLKSRSQIDICTNCTEGTKVFA